MLYINVTFYNASVVNNLNVSFLTNEICKFNFYVTLSNISILIELEKAT